MIARAANGIYWASIGLAALCVLFGLWSSLFGGVGIGGALLFYLMIAASIYLIGTWVFWSDRRA
jgi:hypothetical protein